MCRRARLGANQAPAQDPRAKGGPNPRAPASRSPRAYLDVGGHIGIPVVLAASFDPTLAILTLEPMRQTFFYLRWNLLANGLGESRNSDRVVAWNRPEFESGMA